MNSCSPQAAASVVGMHGGNGREGSRSGYKGSRPQAGSAAAPKAVVGRPV